MISLNSGNFNAINFKIIMYKLILKLIEEFKEDYSKHFSYILSRLRKDEREYIAYYRLPLKDIEPDYKFIRQLKKLNKI